MELVTEFFYEIFRRIIPGLVAIALYWRHELVSFFNTRKGFSLEIGDVSFSYVPWDFLDGHHDFLVVVFIAVLLLAGWLVGFVIQTGMGLVFGIVGAMVWEPRGRGVLRWVRNRLPRSHIQNEKENTHGDDREKRRQTYLTYAEKEMSRSLWAIFLFAGTIDVHPCSIGLHCPSKFFFLAFLAFFWSWILGVIIDADLVINNPRANRIPPNS